MANLRKFLERKTPGFIINTTRGKKMRDGFTLVCTFSRDWCVHNFFAHLNRMYMDLPHCHLLVFDNSDMVPLAEHLHKKLQAYLYSFASVRFYKSWRRGGTETVADDSKGWACSKLPQILAMHHDFIGMVTTEKFVLLEDDTLAPPNTVTRLLSILDEYPSCGLATGIETGRSLWAYAKTRLGVHYIIRKGPKILERISPSPHLRGIHKVDACGWYACASYKRVWLEGLRQIDPAKQEIPRFALDGLHTNNISLGGHDILADFSLWCKHMQHMEDRIIFWGKKQARPMIDVWLPRWGTYAQGIVLDTRAQKRMVTALGRRRDRAFLKNKKETKKK